MKKTVSLNIDGKRIFAKEGTTILEAAKQNGIAIPTLCYHSRLTPLGHCRICIVSVEGIERPITSCDNPVTDGMVVTTNTTGLQEMRSQIVELSLSTHPYKDCLTCVRTGTCELQDKAYQYQVNLPEQLDRAIPPKKSADNPYIVRDEEKCILCGRCIQVCRSGPGCFVYSMIGNGVNTRVVPFRNGREVSLEEAGCIFCGQCIDVCPVAALTEMGRSAGGREWELSTTAGICIECSLGCYLERQASGGKLVKITVPGEGDQVSWLCRKGKFGFSKESATKPVTTVMRRGVSGYAEISYDDAIRETAKTISAIKEKYGAGALAVLASGQVSNEESYLLQKLVRTVLGTANVDCGVEPAWAKSLIGMHAVTGMGITGPTPAFVRHAEAILIVGSGLAESHPVAAMAVNQAGRFGDAVVVRTEAALADNVAWESILLEPGKGGYETLFKTMAIIARGEDTTEAIARAGLPNELVIKAVRLITGTNSCTVVCPLFFDKAGPDMVDALLDMAKACGQIEQGRSKLLLLSKYSNAAGVLATGGMPLCGPGFAELNGDSGLNREEVIAAIDSGKVKGLFTFGGSFSTISKGNLEYLAAVVGSEDETPIGADLIFPAQQFADKDGLFTNSAGQTRHNESRLPPGSGPLPDWRLICDLARAMGAKWHYASLEDVREEMKSLVSAGASSTA